MRFDGRTAIVTGAGNGIGAAICARLCQDGAVVVVADIDMPAAQRVADQLTQEGGKALAFEVDVSKEAQVAALVEAAVKLGGGRLHYLVNNAASFVYTSVEETSEEQWDLSLGTNVKGYAFCIKHAAAAMRGNGGDDTAGGGGAIVNVSSVCATLTIPRFAPYATTKAAILQLTRSASADLGGAGVRVNAVCPGPIMTTSTKRHADSQGKTVDEIIDEMKSGLIIKRMGTTTEVASAVSFLLSDEASYVTGATLTVDGGMTVL